MIISLERRLPASMRHSNKILPVKYFVLQPSQGSVSKQRLHRAKLFSMPQVHSDNSPIQCMASEEFADDSHGRHAIACVEESREYNQQIPIQELAIFREF